MLHCALLCLVDVQWIMFFVFVHHLPHLLSLTPQSWWQFVVDVIEEFVNVGLGFFPCLLHGLLYLLLSLAMKVILKVLQGSGRKEENYFRPTPTLVERGAHNEKGEGEKHAVSS